MFSTRNNQHSYSNLDGTKVTSNTTSLISGSNTRRAFRDVTNKGNVNNILPGKSRSGMNGVLNKTQKYQQAPKIKIAVDPHSSVQSFSNFSSKGGYRAPKQSSVQPLGNLSSNVGRYQAPGQSILQPFGNVNSNVRDGNVMKKTRNPLQPIGHFQHQTSRSKQGPTVSSYSKYMGKVDNIDARNVDEPLMATDYVEDMYAHFREKEGLTVVLPVYMEETQPHITEKMRSILVDWLMEVHMKFKLAPETMYLCVNLIDRYLERREVARPHLQMLGVACLMIATKYEEIYPPSVQELVYICDNAYTSSQIISMETQVLRVLEYQITQPSAHTFLVRFLHAGHADKIMSQLACFLLDGTLLSYSLLEYTPSQLAAASVFLARFASGRRPWSATLIKYSRYVEEEIKPVARAILKEKVTNSADLVSINKKYSSSRYGKVANTPIDFDF